MKLPTLREVGTEAKLLHWNPERDKALPVILLDEGTGPGPRVGAKG